jgi:hypothetical protein
MLVGGDWPDTVTGFNHNPLIQKANAPTGMPVVDEYRFSAEANATRVPARQYTPGGCRLPIMKVPISDHALIDLDAPVLSAYEAVVKGAVRWLVWRKHGEARHRHGAAEGHRAAHCNDSTSPYWKTGYNLAYAGQWKPEQGHYR